MSVLLQDYMGGVESTGNIPDNAVTWVCHNQQHLFDKADINAIKGIIINICTNITLVNNVDKFHAQCF